MAGERILIVDDNATNLKLARVLLEDAGYDVVCASDAREALRELEQRIPDLVLVDIALPDIDGLTLTRQLRADPRYASLIIVALSAYAMQRDKDRAAEAGCNGYITKPIDIDGLPAAVAAHLQGRF